LIAGQEEDFMSKRFFTLVIALAMIAGHALTSATARAELLSYYIGVDGLETIATGTYQGQPNPNYNHLTFLFAHANEVTPASNHYHSKAIRTYTGPAENPSIIRSTSNYVPEGSLSPINLSAGSGLYAGKLVSNPYTDPMDPVYHFSHLTHGDTQSLNGFAAGSGEFVMFNSSGGRWTPNPRPAHLHVEIVSLTPGLNIGDALTMNLGGAGTELHLTDPGEPLDFTPVLWTEANAVPGTYEAVFRFFDEDGMFGESGNVRFLVAVPVPEPATAMLLSLAATGLVLFRRSRQSL
jgi:hypothetical protein